MLLKFVWVFCLSFVVYSKTEANPRILLPETLEDDHLKRAKPLMNEIVLRFERARKEYNKKGPQAFVDSLSDKITTEDKKEIVQILAKLPELPQAKFAEQVLTLNFENGKSYEFQLADVIMGKFKSGTYNKKFNYNLSPKENLEIFNLKDEKKSYSNLFDQILRSVFIPLSYASSIKEGRDAAVISIGTTIKAHTLAPLGFVYYGRPGQEGH